MHLKGFTLILVYIIILVTAIVFYMLYIMNASYDIRIRYTIHYFNVPIIKNDTFSRCIWVEITITKLHPFY